MYKNKGRYVITNIVLELGILYKFVEQTYFDRVLCNIIIYDDGRNNLYVCLTSVSRLISIIMQNIYSCFMVRCYACQTFS